MFKTEYLPQISHFNRWPTMIKTTCLFIIIGFFIFSSFLKAQEVQDNKYIPYPQTRFAVIADPHVFDIKGNINNPIYLKYGVEDKNILQLSSEILETTVDKIIKKDNLDFVIIPGDLTDSGDIQSHKVVANILNKFKSHGIDVYIIPGNHDGFNTKDFTNTNIPREIISPQDFINIYKNCGYSEAIYQDDNSLSYIVEPIKGLWLVMIDSCIYHSKDHYHVCNGRIRESTQKWLDNILDIAIKKNKAVMGVLHHSLLEHYQGQNRFFSKYIVDDFNELSTKFAAQNMKVVFTGHHHAQDIVKKEFENNTFIYDIETSSLIAYPNAFRIVEINSNNEIFIKSYYLKNINSFQGDFSNYTKNHVQKRVKNVAEDKLDKFYLNPIDKDKISQQAAIAMMAHYMGDEQPPESLAIEDLNLWSKFIYSFYRNLLSSLYDDPAPNDLNIKINLHTGSWSELE
ncbi:MAG TPA: metallophosphoesterase [Halanaerobiales bacterium]|nr:metallophosphoesterase [Halanaerobiales bacterium]